MQRKGYKYCEFRSARNSNERSRKRDEMEGKVIIYLTGRK